MPVTRIQIRQGRSPTEKKALLEAIHRAKVEALKIPERDHEQMICEYSPDDFEIPPHKTEKYTIIEITMYAGRSLSAKHHLYEAIVSKLGTASDKHQAGRHPHRAPRGSAGELGNSRPSWV